MNICHVNKDKEVIASDIFSARKTLEIRRVRLYGMAIPNIEEEKCFLMPVFKMEIAFLPLKSSF